MRKKLLLLTILLLIPFNLTFSQVAPEYNSAVLAGPVMVDEEIAGHIGYSKEFFGFHLVGFGLFGETVEAAAEAVKLFPIVGKLHIGPIAGVGSDWSNVQGTGGDAIKASLFGAAGLGATYGFNDRIGGWGFWKTRIESEFKGKFGFGIYYRI